MVRLGFHRLTQWLERFAVGPVAAGPDRDQFARAVVHRARVVQTLTVVMAWRPGLKAQAQRLGVWAVSGGITRPWEFRHGGAGRGTWPPPQRWRFPPPIRPSPSPTPPRPPSNRHLTCQALWRALRQHLLVVSSCRWRGSLQPVQAFLPPRSRRLLTAFA